MKTHEILEKAKNEKGFTLVELAVVMIIIGLLIGGVLKGQELIANAQVNSTTAQVKGIDAAIGTFKDIYNSMPGDMGTAEARLPNCGGATCVDGNGNGVHGNLASAVVANGNEGAQAFIHMQKADLFSGIVETGNVANGELAPATDIGGGIRMGFEGAGALAGNTGGPAGRAGHYLAIDGSPAAAVVAGSGFARPSVMRRLDNKLDDGNPNDGLMRAVGDTCLAGVLYNEATDAGLCSAYVRLQN